MKIYLVRHGETILNKKGIVQGWCDSELTAEGLMQANQLGEALKDIPFFRVYSGDLSRQYKTAEAIMFHNVASHTKIIKTKQLREMNFGCFEGTDYVEMMGRFFKRLDVTAETPEEIFAKIDAYDAYNYLYEQDEKGTVEDPLKVFERLVGVMDKVANAGDKNVLIVTSGAALSCLFKNLFANKKESFSFPNCSVAIVEFKNGKYELIQVAKRLF